MRFILSENLFFRVCFSILLTLLMAGGLKLEAQTQQQDQMAYLRAIRLIQEGESLVKSGEQNLARRPTLLNPNQDMREIHERGKRQVDEGKRMIAEGNAIIKEIEERAKRQREEVLKSIEVVELISKPIEILSTEEGLGQAFEYLVQDLPKKITQRIFYHSAFYNNEGKYNRFAVLNDWVRFRLHYLEEGGEKISLLPEIDWVVNEEHPLGSIRNERLDPFRDTQSAAITVMEIINWNDFPWLVLSLTTSEVESWKVLDQKVWFIKRDTAAQQWFGVSISDSSEMDNNTVVQAKAIDQVAFIEYIRNFNGNYIHRLDNGRGNPFAPFLQFWQTLIKLNLADNKIPVNNYDWVRRALFSRATPFHVVDKRSQAALRISSTKSESEMPQARLETFDLTTQRSSNWGTVTLELISLPQDTALENQSNAQ